MDQQVNSESSFVINLAEQLLYKKYHFWLEVTALSKSKRHCTSLYFLMTCLFDCSTLPHGESHRTTETWDQIEATSPFYHGGKQSE